MTRTVLSLALDAASLRQQTIATNIASANATGYVPQRVSFESQLAEARRNLRETGEIDGATLGRVRPRAESATDGFGPGATVQLDVEAARMASNAVHYQALAKGLSRHFAILSMAVGDGRK